MLIVYTQAFLFPPHPLSRLEVHPLLIVQDILFSIVTSLPAAT